MEEEVLVTHANLRNAQTEERAGNAAQHLIEIDDDVGSALLDILAYQMDTRQIRWEPRAYCKPGSAGD